MFNYTDLEKNGIGLDSNFLDKSNITISKFESKKKNLISIQENQNLGLFATPTNNKKDIEIKNMLVGEQKIEEYKKSESKQVNLDYPFSRNLITNDEDWRSWIDNIKQVKAKRSCFPQHTNEYDVIENEYLSNMYSKKFFADCSNKENHPTYESEYLLSLVHKQTFCPINRERAIDYLYDCSLKNGLDCNSYYLAASLFDRLLIEFSAKSNKDTNTNNKEDFEKISFKSKGDLMLLSAACLLISSKFHDKESISPDKIMEGWKFFSVFR